MIQENKIISLTQNCYIVCSLLVFDSFSKAFACINQSFAEFLHVRHENGACFCITDDARQVVQEFSVVVNDWIVHNNLKWNGTLMNNSVKGVRFTMFVLFTIAWGDASVSTISLFPPSGTTYSSSGSVKSVKNSIPLNFFFLFLSAESSFSQRPRGILDAVVPKVQLQKTACQYQFGGKVFQIPNGCQNHQEHL